MLMIRECLGTCWSSEDVGGLQEVLGDDTHGAVQFTDPPAVDVVLLDTKGRVIHEISLIIGFQEKQKKTDLSKIINYFTRFQNRVA